MEDSRRKSEFIKLLEIKTQQFEKFRDLETRTATENRSLLEENHMLLQENQNLRVNEGVLNGKIEVFKGHIEENEMDIMIFKTTEADLRKGLEELMNEKDGILHTLKEETDDKERIELEVYELREENFLLGDKVEALELENEIIRSEKLEELQEIERIKQVFQNNIEVKCKEIDDYKGEIAGFKEDINGYKEDLCGLNKDIEDIKGEVVGYKEEIDRCRKEIIDKSNDIDMLKQENESGRLEIEILRCEMNECKKEINLGKNKFEEISMENHKLLNENTQFSDEIKRISQENEDLKARNQAEILKLNDLLITIKEKIRERDRRIECLIRDNEAKEQELFRTAINLQEILNQSKEAFEELKLLENVKQENEKLKKSLETSNEENERINQLYKRLEYQANIMKANYRIKENEIKKVFEEKKLADLLKTKYLKQANM